MEERNKKESRAALWGQLSIRLKEARELLGVSEGEAAKAFGALKRDVVQLENGTKRLLPAEYLHYLQERGVDLNSLFGAGPARMSSAFSSFGPAKDMEARLRAIEQKVFGRNQLSPAAVSDNGVGATKRDAG